MRIYFIRHGETDWNRELRLQGREDIPLNDNGKTQAIRCAASIKELAVDLIVTSPLQRARDTAHMIGNEIGVQTIVIDEDIIERDFGEASGMTYHDKKEKYKNIKIPGYEPKESLIKRMKRAIGRYSNQYPEGHVIMVSHGGTINALLSVISNGVVGSGKTRLKNTGISIIDVEDQQIKLIDYNLEADEFAQKYLYI